MRRQEIATIQTAPTSLPRKSSKATGRILDAVRALPHSRNQILLSKLNLHSRKQNRRPGLSNPALATTARLSQTGALSSRRPVRSNLKPVRSSRKPGLTGGSIAHLRMPVRSVRRRGLNSHASSLATVRLLHTTLPAASMMSIRSTITATGFTVCRLAIA